MWLNENSSREEILKYAKNSPLIFLINFSDESWAQPYIDGAAKLAAKGKPLGFLYYFSDKPWAQPYIDESIRRNPNLFLKKCIKVSAVSIIALLAIFTLTISHLFG